MTAFLIFAALVLNAVAALYFSDYFYRRGLEAGKKREENWWISIENSVEKTQQEMGRRGK